MLVPVLVRHTLLALSPYWLGFKVFAPHASASFRKSLRNPLLGLGSSSEYTQTSSHRFAASETEAVGTHQRRTPARLPPVRICSPTAYSHREQRHLMTGITSPVACAFRFSQPLDAFIRPRPAGPVSCQIRPWGSGSQQPRLKAPRT
jgi:hypothetical protein